MFDLSKLGDMAKIAGEAKQMQEKQERNSGKPRFPEAKHYGRNGKRVWGLRMRIKAVSVQSLFFIFLLLLPLSRCQAADPVTVASVIDGETLQLSSGEKVRLIGIDVPASSKNAKLRDDIKNTGKEGPVLIAAGKNAAKFLRKLIKNEKVVLEYDAQEDERSGLKWAYVYFYLDPHLNMEIPEAWYAELSPGTGERQLRVFLNATLIKEGYALRKIIPPNVKYQALFSKLQEEAKAQKRGLWE